MYAIMNRRDMQALGRTAGRRRTLVAVHAALTAASIALWLGSVHLAPLWMPVALLALVLPWCVAMGAINATTRGLLELRGHMLDERQLVERDRVRSVAHRITLGLLFAAAAGTGLAMWLADVRFDGSLLFPALFALLVTHWMLPAWVACLRVQDDLPDEDFEPVGN
ncbi:hypothetical protein EIZ62_12420 [Streptomyces ficellus]|uniref:Uncharacterized protein n=2 Tax=Streptomyces ficellus TaxID=1977088 RepID=A0A6I6FFY6_9ACTN|nr:hypothetical protein EIZ62_12420 [Streptomyces ficellus]